MKWDRVTKWMVKNNRWIIISGITLVLAVSLFAKSHQGGVAQGVPDEEPTISLYMHTTGEVQHMPLEKYLEGVVAAEMDPTWPTAALEAQAVVARTFTLKKIAEGGVAARGTDASTDPREFQAYNASRVTDRVKQVVADTRGMIMLHAGKPINAWFHAASGGMTASAVEGLGYKKEATPYVLPVNDMQAEPAHPWFHTFTTSQVAKAAAAVGVDVGQVTSIGIGRKGPSGRAQTLKINGKEVPAPSFRLALGDTLMRSTLLDSVQLEGDSVVMKGRGYGHGVGMSQWGAWMMAQQGKSAKDILGYYYRGIKLQTAWD